MIARARREMHSGTRVAHFARTETWRQMMGPTKQKLRVLFALAALVVSSGCLPPRAAPTTTKTAVPVPSLTAAAGASESQQRGGVVLELPAPTFELTEKTTSTCDQKTTADTDGIAMYDVAQTTAFAAEPPALQFKLKVSNKSSKIVKLADVMFKVVVANEEAKIKVDDVKDVVLRPEDTKEVAIVGPAWQQLPNQTSIVVTVFGVPTEFDDANNVTKTDNFEWAFDYQVTSVEKDVRMSSGYRYLSAQDAANLCTSPDAAENSAEPSTVFPGN